MQHRVVLDVRGSLVNGPIGQGERIAPPRLADVVAGAIHLLRAFGPDQVGFLGTDVADAFHRAPLSLG
eukprot:6400138-Alexandrium_andersonii.AAC.1